MRMTNYVSGHFEEDEETDTDEDSELSANKIEESKLNEF
jgi:hypothetical protein